MLKSSTYTTEESFFTWHKITFNATLTENIIIHCRITNEKQGFRKLPESICQEGKILR